MEHQPYRRYVVKKTHHIAELVQRNYIRPVRQLAHRIRMKVHLLGADTRAAAAAQRTRRPGRVAVWAHILSMRDLDRAVHSRGACIAYRHARVLRGGAVG